MTRSRRRLAVQTVICRPKFASEAHKLAWCVLLFGIKFQIPNSVMLSLEREGHAFIRRGRLQSSFLYSMRVGFSDIHPTLYVVSQ